MVELHAIIFLPLKLCIVFQIKSLDNVNVYSDELPSFLILRVKKTRKNEQ